jgi:hypothetical protein
MEKREPLHSVEDFLSTCQEDLNFPPDDVTEIPLESERGMVVELKDASPEEIAAFLEARKGQSIDDAYNLMASAARMAVWALRTGSPGPLEASIRLFLIANEGLDWRDAIRGFFVIGDCAERLGVDLKAITERVKGIMTDSVRSTIYDGYFGRPEGGRDLQPMHLAAMNGEDGIYYVNWP